MVARAPSPAKGLRPVTGPMEETNGSLTAGLNVWRYRRHAGEGARATPENGKGHADFSTRPLFMPAT
jgi:hypothetical protein